MTQQNRLVFYTNIPKNAAERELKAYEATGLIYVEQDTADYWTSEIKIMLHGQPRWLEKDAELAREPLVFGNRAQKMALDALTVYNLAHAVLKKENHSVLPRPDSLGFELVPKN